jgi:tetratricopeptide (TPR) repeat protein
VRLPGGWGFGASFENLGLGEPSGGLASSVRLGASRLMGNPKDLSLLLALGGALQPEGSGSVQAGFEGSYRSTFFVRAGYNLRLEESGYDGLQGLTAGAGAVVESFRLDYAFVPYGELGSTHLVSLAYTFGADVGGPDTASDASAKGNRRPAPSSQAVPAAAPPMPSAPTTVYVREPAQARTMPQVAPKPVAPAASDRTERTITMEFEVPAGGGIAQAKALASAGRDAEAVQALRAILEKDPKDAVAWRELGNVYFKVKRKDYAIQCYEQFLRLRPEDRALADWLLRYKAQ